MSWDLVDKKIGKYKMFHFNFDDFTPSIWWRLNTIWAAPLPLSEEHFKSETIKMLEEIISELKGGDTNEEESKTSTKGG